MHCDVTPLYRCQCWCRLPPLFFDAYGFQFLLGIATMGARGEGGPALLQAFDAERLFATFHDAPPIRVFPTDDAHPRLFLHGQGSPELTTDFLDGFSAQIVPGSVYQPSDGIGLSVSEHRLYVRMPIDAQIVDEPFYHLFSGQKLSGDRQLVRSDADFLIYVPDHFQVSEHQCGLEYQQLALPVVHPGEDEIETVALLVQRREHSGNRPIHV